MGGQYGSGGLTNRKNRFVGADDEGSAWLASLDSAGPRDAMSELFADDPPDDEPVHAATLALFDYLIACKESGEDPAAGLDAFAELAADPEALAEVAEGETQTFAEWDESKHPRDKNGRYISRDAIQDAKTDVHKAAELRERVKPEDRAKLEKAISGEADVGRTKKGQARHDAAERRRAKTASAEKARSILVKIHGEGVTAADLEELTAHLPALPVAKLRSARQLLAASWGGAKGREAMVKRLVEHVRQRAAAGGEDEDTRPEREGLPKNWKDAGKTEPKGEPESVRAGAGKKDEPASPPPPAADKPKVEPVPYEVQGDTLLVPAAGRASYQSLIGFAPSLGAKYTGTHWKVPVAKRAELDAILSGQTRHPPADVAAHQAARRLSHDPDEDRPVVRSQKNLGMMSKADALARAAGLRPGQVYDREGVLHVVTAVEPPRYASRDDVASGEKTGPAGWSLVYTAVPIRRPPTKPDAPARGDGGPAGAEPGGVTPAADKPEFTTADVRKAMKGVRLVKGETHDTLAAWASDQLDQGYARGEVENALRAAAEAGVNPVKSDNLASLEEYMNALEEDPDATGNPVDRSDDSPSAGLSGVLAAHDAAPPRAKEYLAAELENAGLTPGKAAPKDVDEKLLARRVASAYRDLHAAGGTDEELAAVRKAAEAAGVEFEHEPGDEVTFDGASMESGPGVFPGKDRVRVVSPALTHGGRVLVKAKVEPVK